MTTPPPSADPERRLFEGALDHPAGPAREAWLAEACGGDAELRGNVEELLGAHEEQSRFLQQDIPTFITGPAEQPGDSIGPYKLRERIGEGGFGVVWVADQERPVQRRVALKIIKPGMDTREVIARFAQERQALALMDHPHIARVFDAGATEQGRPYFAMELVRGVKITDYCDEQGLSMRERIELFIHVCQAVQHAHQKGIIHRDLKPSNILITTNDGEPVPKVIDFGVAKATQGRLSGHTIYTQFQQMIGTPLYMSPEQAEMTSLDIDTRSDIYALGVLLYELLTGRTPIDAETLRQAGMDEMRRLIREVNPPRPSARLKTMAGAELTTTAKRRHIEPAKLTGALRGDLDWIVMKCLEKDRKRRYDTANGLALDLRRHLQNGIVTARPPTAAYLLGRLVRRNKLAFAAGAAIVASMVAGTAVSVWQAVRANRTLDELRATAPAFAEQARALVAEERFDEAIEKLDYAAKLRPDAADYLIAKADLLQCQMKLAEAVEVYRAALRVQPGNARAAASARLCGELIATAPHEHGRLTRESLAKLHTAMQAEQRPAAELMPVARLLGEEKKLLVDYWLERLRDLPVSAARPLRERLAARDDGLLSLDLQGVNLTDLSPLAGAPLAALTLSGAPELTDLSPLRGMKLTLLSLEKTGVSDLAPLRDLPSLEKLSLRESNASDLSPLRGLRLKSADFTNSPISDLSPLRGAPLEELWIFGARVTDLSPLAGMPLKSLDLSYCPVLDFKVLAGLPLEACYLQVCRINDLSILRGLPLKKLVLWNCADARNFAVLREIETLELLLLPETFRTLPAEDFAAIESLRSHPALRQIGAHITPSMRYEATGSKELFWEQWDREQGFVAALRSSGFTYVLTKLPSGTYRLSLSNQPVSDLSMLKNAPVTELTLEYCNVADLAPIRELRLRVLDLFKNPVTDLGPLHGMPLEDLGIGGTHVRDLSPLAGLPLKNLRMNFCDHLTDVSILAQIPTLEKIVLPPRAAGVEQLRPLPRLQLLSFRVVPRAPYPPNLSAEQFWKTWDQAPWDRVLTAGGVRFAAEEDADGWWRVHVQTPEFSDSSVFKGARIKELSLYQTAVADLHPLTDLPLEMLAIDATSVADLTPLRAPAISANLRELRLYKVPATDFAPVAACSKLEVLDAARTALSDLSVLRGKRLRTAKLANSKVADISALADMPLEWVTLNGTAVTDLRPLLNCQTLKQLVLPAGARDVAALRALPALTGISYREQPGGAPAQTATEFWTENDNQQPGAPPSAKLAVVIAPDAEWKWLHPLNGLDPAKTAPDFHRTFPLPEFDDSAWKSGRDSADPAGGFGYGKGFTGTDIGTPENEEHRHTAYFRHAFTTIKEHTSLELRCQRDDGIIVYLDGKEIVRDNMKPGPDAYELTAAAKMAPENDGVIHRCPIPGSLAAGSHLLAISVHNAASPGSDLRLGGVSLVEVDSGAR